jgi:hypothetical protein
MAQPNQQLQQSSHHSQFMPSAYVRRDFQDAAYQVSPSTESDQTTISPGETMLNYDLENEQPLFTQASSDLAHAQPQHTYGGHWQQDTPEFPAHLTSMESSASDSAFPRLSAASSALIAVTSSKPIDSAADTGTYSCTYDGCTQRFTTPQKLQKHKRDAHRANPHVTPGVGSGMSTTQLMERNSQTGPHKCERINPTTGKPCNQIFSRPYDLTRHEDTIHNIRKQKVRCALCTEEKTFSRSDALTRHMRVVHPEVDFPGKHRKRGGRE